MAGVISDNRTEHNIPHTISCRALGVSESWFYKWHDRRPTGRELRRQRPADEIEEIFTASGGTYGSPKIFRLLVRRGRRVSVNTVAKLMAELGLVARAVRRRSGLRLPFFAGVDRPWLARSLFTGGAQGFGPGLGLVQSVATAATWRGIMQNGEAPTKGPSWLVPVRLSLRCAW